MSEAIVPAQNNSVTLQYANTTSNLSNDFFKKLLYNYGPVLVAINASEMSSVNPGNSVYTLPNIPADHAVLLVGYNKHYWIIQNSWGNEWGNNGFFAAKMTDSPGQIFQLYCYVDRTDKDIDISMNKDPQGKWALYEFEDSSNNFVDNFVESGVYKLQSLPPGEKYSTGFVPIADNTDKNLEAAMRLSTSKLEDLPDQYATQMCWANSNNRYGKSFVGPISNQGRCGDCWIFSGMEMIASAISIKSFLNNQKPWYVALSVQHILNEYYKLKNLNGCNGGNPQILDDLINRGAIGLLSEAACPLQPRGSFKQCDFKSRPVKPQPASADKDTITIPKEYLIVGIIILLLLLLLF